MARDLENAKRLRKEWYERNKELTKERARAWALANPEKSADSKTKWRQDNMETHNATNREWFANNKDKRASYQAKRNATILQRTPKWDTDAHLIVAKYQVAAMLSRETGEPYHVDHIIPLQGKYVSGLHIFSNLRVIPGSDNVKKSNKYTV
jgi:hypothetical protein